MSTTAPRISSFLLALALVALAPWGAARAEEGSVRFLAPRRLATVLGPTAIRLEVTAPSSRRVDRVELRVDGGRLATLRDPPWQAEWDAGDGSSGHTIEALVFFSDGGVARALTRTSPLKINETLEVDLVNLYPVVRDRSGNYVSDLTRDDFVVLENGERQTIERFTTEHRPLRVAIVLDTSLSMSRQSRLENAQKAALGFLDVLEPDDEGLVVGFSDRVEVVQGITSNRELLAAAIAKAEARGGTALYDAIWRTAKRLEEFPGRRVMVLLSDGRDEAANGFEPGSLHTLEEATTQALRSEVMVFTIGLGRRLDREMAREWTRPLFAPDPDEPGLSLKDVLESIAVTTGGRLLLSPGPGRLRRAFDDVADDLRNQYSIAYSPTNGAKDGSYRRLEVLVPGRDVEVVARKGYYAPLEPESASQ